MFPEINIGNISNLVKDQFPQFYKEQGPDFIAFIEAYYEWLQLPENPIGQARGRYKNFDIDTAAAEFLSHYKEKYMWGLPPELLGNQRLLQKHILELYRSKGSQQAIRLLFRLLFNQDIDFYIPSYDIFKLSDNTWNQRRYLEVTFSRYLDNYPSNMITGAISGATAVVEGYEKRIADSLTDHLLFVSNVTGQFIPNERVLLNGVPEAETPLVRGSVVGLNVTGSTPGIQLGDTLTSINEDFPVEIVVTGTFSGSGQLRFDIVKPGTYYTLDFPTEWQILMPVHLDILNNNVLDQVMGDSPYDFPKANNTNIDSPISSSLWIEGVDNVVAEDIPISGSGAQIDILSISNTHLYQYSTDMVIDYVNVDLDGIYPFPAYPTSNVDTIVADSLSQNAVIVGSISSIIVINPGVNYSANVWFVPKDSLTSTSGITDANGEFVGNNALIVGTPIVGDSIVNGVSIQSSGYNTVKDQLIFAVDGHPDKTLVGTPIIGGIGWEKGYYENTKSFLSDDKYLFDGHYYQDFSYVIRAALTIDRYVDILKDIAHPAGNAVYGDVRILVENQLINDIVDVVVGSRPN